MEERSHRAAPLFGQLAVREKKARGRRRERKEKKGRKKEKEKIFFSNLEISEKNKR
jgi:hypothetical protein